jgi:DNA invertase Pin-like site-specific DNA recombinase
MATHSLSPSFAIAIPARQAAIKAVKADLWARGKRLSYIPPKEIRVIADQYLAAHRAELVAQATEKWRAIAEINARTQSEPKSTTSVVRISGAKMTTIGYARVSTDGQTLDAQQASLTAGGCERVYAEKVSGARSDRAQLAKAIAALGAGDQLVVTRLDRLARSTRDLLNVLDAVVKAGATFRSLTDTWANTDTPHGRLMLTVLGGLAEFERELIKARTTEGRKRAEASGVQFGRKRKLTLHQQQEALARRANGEALVEIARSYAVSHSTISRL